MKKISVLLILMLALTLCILPCYAENDTPVSSDADLNTTVSDGSDAQALGSSSVPGTDSAPEIDTEASEDFGFHPENFVGNLYYMAVGMVGIFIVIGIIILSTVLLNKLFREKATKSE